MNRCTAVPVVVASLVEDDGSVIWRRPRSGQRRQSPIHDWLTVTCWRSWSIVMPGTGARPSGAWCVGADRTTHRWTRQPALLGLSAHVETVNSCAARLSLPDAYLTPDAQRPRHPKMARAST